MRNGISLIEVIVVIGVLLTLLAMASISFLPFRSKSGLDTTALTLISDIRSQQIKAMAGDTEGRQNPASYGIHFENDSYILFHGEDFIPGDPSNFNVPLGDLETESTLPSSQIIFASKSGEVNSFAVGQNTITIRDTVLNTAKTITVNRYGVVTQSN